MKLPSRGGRENVLKSETASAGDNDDMDGRECKELCEIAIRVRLRDLELPSDFVSLCSDREGTAEVLVPSIAWPARHIGVFQECIHQARHD